MEGHKITINPDVVRKDIPRLGSVASVIKRTIYKKLSTHPEIYGGRLRGALKNYWKLRVGDWRVVYEITLQEVVVKGIVHRSDDYKTIIKRLGA